MRRATFPPTGTAVVIETDIKRHIRSFRAPNFFAKSLPLSVSLWTSCTAIVLRYPACSGIRRSRSRVYHGSGHTAYDSAHLRFTEQPHGSATVSSGILSLRTLAVQIGCYSTDSIIDILVLYAVSTGQCYCIPIHSGVRGANLLQGYQIGNIDVL